MLEQILRSRRLASALVASMNMLCVVALLAIPAILGADREALLLLSIGLASLQAGQAAAVQTEVSLGDFKIWMFFGMLISVMSGIYVSATEDNQIATAASTVLFGLAGVLVGGLSGERASQLISSGKTVKYQLFILSRNAVWLFLVIGAAAVDDKYIGFATAFAWQLISLGLIGREPGKSRSMVPMAMGAFSALLYRNDINIARTMATAQSFDTWHYVFVAYTLVQAVVGFLIVNEIFSRRESIRRRANILFVKWASAGMAVLSAAAALWSLSDTSRDFNALNAFVVFPISIWVAVQAALAHVFDLSKVVYVGGLVGIAALLACAALNLSPGQGMVVELALSSGIVATFLVRLHREKPADVDELSSLGTRVTQ